MPSKKPPKRKGFKKLTKAQEQDKFVRGLKSAATSHKKALVNLLEFLGANYTFVKDHAHLIVVTDQSREPFMINLTKGTVENVKPEAPKESVASNDGVSHDAQGQAAENA